VSLRPADPPPIPYSIRLFERMQITALVVGWINAALTYRLVLHDKISPVSYTAAMVAISGVVALLVFRITRRRSSTAKWILIVLSAAATAPWFALLRRTGVADLSGMLSLFQGGLQIAALFLLIRPGARAWFASRID
jgi:hypothetical protein